MAGLAGEAIGLGTASATAIGEPADDASALGCRENFIGFGVGKTSIDQGLPDFTAADDQVTGQDGSLYDPTYTGDELSWTAVP